MRIENKKAKANYVNYKSSGIPKKVEIQAGKIADIPAIINVSQIINFGDFQRGFFEIITDNVKEIKKEEKTNNFEDSLSKVEKKVKDYTDNKEQRIKNKK